MLFYTIVILIIYVLVAIFIGMYDIYRIIRDGQYLEEQREILEHLATIHGYSPDGWSRFQRYQTFMLENGMVLRLYQEYLQNKTWAVTKAILFSFPMVFVLIGSSLSKLIKRKKA